MTPADLIARLSELKGADRGVDSDIFVAAGRAPPPERGYRRGDNEWDRHIWTAAHMPVVEPPPYTGSVDAALTLISIPKTGDHQLVIEIDGNDGHAWVRLEQRGDYPGSANVIAEDDAATAPIAVCLTSLRARQATAEKGKG